jgi:hypothetical protein
MIIPFLYEINPTAIKQPLGESGVIALLYLTSTINLT